MNNTKLRHGSWLLKLATYGTGLLFGLIPLSCGGQSILRTVTPFLLDDSNSILDSIIWAVAPLVLP